VRSLYYGWIKRSTDSRRVAASTPRRRTLSSGRGERLHGGSHTGYLRHYHFVFIPKDRKAPPAEPRSPSTERSAGSCSGPSEDITDDAIKYYIEMHGAELRAATGPRSEISGSHKARLSGTLVAREPIAFRTRGFNHHRKINHNDVSSRFAAPMPVAPIQGKLAPIYQKIGAIYQKTLRRRIWQL
jgi:hypothetical protein